MKKIAAGIATASFLFAMTAAVPSFAAEAWETWPPKTGAPPATAEEAAAAKAGDAAGKKTSTGISRGTIGWAAAIIGGAAIIGIAAASGGGGGGTTPTPSH